MKPKKANLADGTAIITWSLSFYARLWLLFYGRVHCRFKGTGDPDVVEVRLSVIAPEGGTSARRNDQKRRVDEGPEAKQRKAQGHL